MLQLLRHTAKQKGMTLNEYGPFSLFSFLDSAECWASDQEWERSTIPSTRIRMDSDPELSKSSRTNEKSSNFLDFPTSVLSSRIRRSLISLSHIAAARRARLCELATYIPQSWNRSIQNRQTLMILSESSSSPPLHRNNLEDHRLMID